jgi:hypothetical protein
VCGWFPKLVVKLLCSICIVSFVHFLLLAWHT